VAPLFGFAQFEFAGTLGVPDGRYLARGERSEDQRVLVVETIGAPPPAPRRRRRRSEADEATPRPLQLTRVTAVRAAEPFDSEAAAERWLEESFAGDERASALVAEGTALLNRALHAQAVAVADPRLAETAPQRAVLVRIGYGSGEEVAGGRFSAARHVDVRSGPRSRRRQREEELRPQERLAAGSTPARRCCCGPVPTSTPIAGARRRCSSASPSRRCWSSSPAPWPIPAT
jgi:hypothetical protein